MGALVKHDWIVALLGHLADYARTHGLGALAVHLDEARDLALLEIANRSAGESTSDDP